MLQNLTKQDIMLKRKVIVSTNDFKCAQRTSEEEKCWDVKNTPFSESCTP